MITIDQLLAIMPFARQRAPAFIEPLNATMAEFGIDTPARVAAYLAQVGHESGQLRYVVEQADGSAYEGRKDLGNVWPGDGKTFKGHGLIQITGRTNHQAVAVYFNKTLVEVATWMMTPEGAARSSGWFWKTHGCNAFADQGDFVGLTKRINGGINGLADRQALHARALEALRVA